MRNNKGFTLLELLVAATIIGVMAVFATISYKNSAADARMAAYKARTDALAGAVQRMRLEYPHVSIAGPMGASSKLVAKGFLESGGWDDGYVTYYVCNGKTESCASSPIDSPLACVVSRIKSDDRKFPARYRKGYIYCVSANNKKETLAAGGE